MERIKLDGTSVVSGAIAGLGVGSVLGYLLCRHLSRNRLEARIKQEVDAAHDFYKARAVKASVGTADLVIDAIRAEALRDLADSQDPDEDDDEGMDLNGFPVEEEGLEEDGWPPADRDTSRPYVISVVEWSDHEVPVGWQQMVMTWYEGDNVLVDEQETPVRDIRGTTGPLNLGLFQKNSVSGDPTRCFIRNDRIQVDFEVILDRRTWTEGVLNYGNPRTPDG